MPPFNSILNALDQGNIPFYLKNLTYMEKRLLCKIQVLMTVVILPGGQLEEKGLTIDFPIEITKSSFGTSSNLKKFKCHYRVI